MMDKKKAHHISAPISNQYMRLGNFTTDSLLDEYPPPAYQPSYQPDYEKSIYSNPKIGKITHKIHFNYHKIHFKL